MGMRTFLEFSRFLTFNIFFKKKFSDTKAVEILLFSFDYFYFYEKIWNTYIFRN